MVRNDTYLLGGNGAPNFGDELMAKAWIDDLTAAFPDSRITLDCNSPEPAREFLRLDGTRVESINGIKTFCNAEIRKMFADVPKASDRFMLSLRYGLEFFRSGSYREVKRIRDALDRIENARTFHVFGGGYINVSVRPDSAFLIGFAAAVKRQFGCKVVATGLGVTPLVFDGKESTASLAEALAEFDVFECRDCYGYDQLFDVTNNQANLVNGVDDTFMTRFAPRARGGQPRRLHLCFLKPDIAEKLPGLKEEVMGIVPSFDEVTYWNCTPRLGDDNLDALRKELPRMRVLDCDELVHGEIPVSPGDYMVTQRFHPHLIGARLGCTGVFVQQSVYYHDKHRSVVHLGSDFKKWSPGNIRPAADPAPARILERDAENMARKARIRHLCYGTAPASAARTPVTAPLL